VFQVGDLVLLWDKRREKSVDHSKFDSLWLGPFSVHASVGPTLLGLPIWMVMSCSFLSMGSVLNTFSSEGQNPFNIFRYLRALD
jgi:hypothetical protein